MGKRVRLSGPRVVHDDPDSAVTLVDGSERCPMGRETGGLYYMTIPYEYGTGTAFCIVAELTPEKLEKTVKGLRWLSFKEMGLREADFTFSYYAGQWMRENLGQYSERTQNRYHAAYMDLIFSYSWFHEAKIEEIWGWDIEDWEDWMEAQTAFLPYKRRDALTVMRHILKALYDEHYYHYDLGRRHLKSIPKRQHKEVRRQQVPDGKLRELFFRNPDKGAALLEAAGYQMVLRPGETTALRREQRHESSHLVTIDSQIQDSAGGDRHTYTEKADLVLKHQTKGKRRRQVCYGEGMEKVFREMEVEQNLQKKRNPFYRNEMEYYVTEEDGTPISPRRLSQNVRDVTAGTVRLYDATRHQGITRMYHDLRLREEYNKADVWRNFRLLEGIADAAGHEDIRTTCNYILPTELGPWMVAGDIRTFLEEMQEAEED